VSAQELIPAGETTDLDAEQKSGLLAATLANMRELAKKVAPLQVQPKHFTRAEFVPGMGTVTWSQFPDEVWVQANEHQTPGIDSPRGMEIACTFLKDTHGTWELNQGVDNGFIVSSKNPDDHTHRSYITVTRQGERFVPEPTYGLELSADDYQKAVDFSAAMVAGFHAEDKAI